MKATNISGSVAMFLTHCRRVLSCETHGFLTEVAGFERIEWPISTRMTDSLGEDIHDDLVDPIGVYSRIRSSASLALLLTV